MFGKLLRKILLVAGIALVSGCQVTERQDWNNIHDQQGSAWTPHTLLIGDQDTLYLNPGDTLHLGVGFTPSSGDSVLSRVAWSARNLLTGAILELMPSIWGGLEVPMPVGRWMVRVQAPPAGGGTYASDSQLVVVAAGHAPLPIRHADTALIGSGSVQLAATDPNGRPLSFEFQINGIWQDGSVVSARMIADPGIRRIMWKVTNSVGLSDTSSFLLRLRPDTIIDHGTSYRIKAFGDQVWMIDNLNRDTANGKGSWCYDNLPENCARYGRLYDWKTATGGKAAMTFDYWYADRIQGICPKGWRVPTSDDVQYLNIWLREGGSAVPNELVGRALEADSLWRPFFSTSAWRGFSGFELLPGGFFDTDSNKFFHLAAHANFWTTSHKGSDSAIFYGVWENDFYRDSDYNLGNEARSIAGNLVPVTFPVRFGYSVRCLEN